MRKSLENFTPAGEKQIGGFSEQQSGIIQQENDIIYVSRENRAQTENKEIPPSTLTRPRSKRMCADFSERKLFPSNSLGERIYI